MTRGEIYRSLAGRRKVKVVQQREAFDVNITRWYYMDGDRRRVNASQSHRFTQHYERIK